MMGMAWQQEFEAAGNTESTLRKQKAMNEGAQMGHCFLFLCSLGSHSQNGEPFHLINPNIETASPACLGVYLLVVLDPVKLTILSIAALVTR